MRTSKNSFSRQLADLSATETAGQQKISEIFGQNVFNLITMKEYLTEGTFYKMMDVIKFNGTIDYQTAENVAKGMKK